MTDLSKVLGDLYGGGNPDGPPVAQEPSAHERTTPNEERTESGASTDDLQSVLSEALATMPATHHEEVVEAAEEWAEKFDETHEETGHLHQRGALRAWQPSDDDFLPSHGHKKHKSKK